jgi:hypothetical protein
MSRATAVAALILAAYASAAEAASAMTVTVNRSGASMRVEVTGESNLDEKNNIGVTEDASNTYVEDTSNETDAVVPTGTCFQVSARKVGCPANPSNTTALEVMSGQGDDAVSIGLPPRSASGIATVAVYGGTGKDNLVGSEGPDTLEGEGRDGTGNGIPATVPGFDLSTGDALFGRGGRDMLRGGQGRDYLNGGTLTTGADEANTLDGGAQNDLLDIGPTLGPDRVIGGSDEGPSSIAGVELAPEQGTFTRGGDVASYARRTFSAPGTSGVTVDLDTSADDGATGAGEGDQVDPDVESIIGSVRDDRLVGTGDVERLEGGLGSDSMSGGGGADSLRFREGVRDKCYTLTSGATVDLDLIDPSPEDCQIRLLPTTVRLTKSPRDETMEPPVIGSSLRRASKGLRATLRCDGDAPKSCAGVMTLQGARGGKRLARARFRVRPGRSGRVLLRLAPERARKLGAARLTTVGRGVSRRGSTTVIAARRVR